VRRTRILALLGVLAVWAAVSYGNRALGVMMPALLPTPGDVGAVFAETVRDGTLWRHVVTSLGRLALGLLAAMCVPVRLMLEPIIEFVRPIPPLAFLPMFLVWFGLGEGSKVAFIGYTTFFPMFVAVAAAVLRVDVTLLRAAASLGAGHLDLIRRVIVPAALPGIIVALRLGFALALFVIVGAEFMGADAGLGHLIMEGRTFFLPAQIVMGALVLGLLGSVVNALLLAAERRLFRWREAGATS